MESSLPLLNNPFAYGDFPIDLPRPFFYPAAAAPAAAPARRAAAREDALEEPRGPRKTRQLQASEKEDTCAIC
ncbi:MAG TPA: hypothetical protein VN457_04765, partial [Chlamydiales bacterium]|nr:hypothetical protein [Chlamydiales bacterium]